MSDVITQSDRVVVEPAADALGYGQRAVDDGVLLAQAPGQPKNKQPPPACIASPDLLKKARQVLSTVRPGVALMQGVRFELMTAYPIKAIRDFTAFAAWTNTSTEIYIRCQGLSDAQVRFVVFHESLHIDQFKANGDAVPTYTQVMRFEFEAYKQTAEWLEDPRFNKETPEIKQLAKASRDACNVLRQGIKAVEAATSDAKQQEIEYEKFLKDPDNDMLPKHQKLADLYSRP